MLTCMTLQERRYVCCNPDCRHQTDAWLAPGEKAQPRCDCGGEMKRPYHKPRVRTLADAGISDATRKARVLEQYLPLP